MSKKQLPPVGTPITHTTRIAEYIRGLGYPVAQIIGETDDLEGAIVLIDTNPTREKGKERALLTAYVDPVTRKVRGKPNVVELQCRVVGERWYKNGKRACECRFMCDDLSDLETNVEDQISIARMVREELKLDRNDAVFDAEELQLKADVVYLRQDLKEAEEKLVAYQEQRRAKAAKMRKVVPLK